MYIQVLIGIIVDHIFADTAFVKMGCNGHRLHGVEPIE